MYLLLILLNFALFLSECQQLATMPDWLDWRTQGYVTPVKRQKCDDCWAFTTMGALEGAYYRATGKLVDLSPQQLVDCTLDGQGCSSGSNAPTGFDYIIKNGFSPLTDYPYTGKVGGRERENARCFLFSLIPYLYPGWNV